MFCILVLKLCEGLFLCVCVCVCVWIDSQYQISDCLELLILRRGMCVCNFSPHQRDRVGLITSQGIEEKEREYNSYHIRIVPPI
jgi:hypothetical protein